MRELIVTDTSRQRWILTSVAFGMFMSNLDISIVNISLPVISQYFNVSIGIVSRVVLVYFLILTGFLLGFGKLGDIKGFKKVFIAGFFIFILGSFLCGISGSINQLIAFRVIQAIGGSILTALPPAIVTTLLPTNTRGKALGIVGIFAAFGISVGPAVGGFITAYLNWRWIFFINIPLGIIAIFMGNWVLPGKQVKSEDSRFDIPGIVFIFVALMTLLYALNMGQELGWTSPIILLCFLASLTFFAAFFFLEKKTSYPLVDLNLFTNWNFSMGTLASLFVLMVLNGVVFLFPFYLEVARGLEINKAGLILVIPSAVMIFMGPVAGSISDRTGSRWLCAVGMFLCSGSLFMFSFLQHNSSILFITLSLAVFGLTAGMFMAPNSSLLMGEVPEDLRGVASSIMMLVRNGGGVLGVCFFETIFSSSLPQNISMENITLAHSTISSHVLIGGFHNAFIFGIFLCLAASLSSAFVRK